MRVILYHMLYYCTVSMILYSYDVVGLILRYSLPFQQVFDIVVSNKLTVQPDLETYWYRRLRPESDSESEQ